MTQPNLTRGDRNEGHGHVYPRADGHKARCGGPTLCKECATDLAQKSMPTQQPTRGDELTSAQPVLWQYYDAGQWWPTDNGAKFPDHIPKRALYTHPQPDRAASEPPAGDAVAPDDVEGYAVAQLRRVREDIEEGRRSGISKLRAVDLRWEESVLQHYLDSAAAPSPAVRADDAKDAEVVGHKTFYDAATGFRHEPLMRGEADKLMAQVREADAKRVAMMPDEESAIRLFFDSWKRLTDLGWKEAMYCPKDRSIFEVIEAGSTGIFKCIYEGEWPKGTYWILEDGDMSPSRPVLFRAIEQDAAAREPRT